MGKNKKEKPKLTLENLNRAIRTYQREEVLYLIQHGISKDIPEDEKTATYQQLVSLQNMEILQSVARQENFLDPEIFCNQSDSSQSKVFVNQCLTKFRKQFLLQDDDVCNTLFTLACACGCISMLHILIEQKKVKERYPELAQYSLDVLKTVKKIPAGTMSGTDLVQLYFLAAISADCEKKLDYLSASGFDLYVKNASGKTVIDRLEERIKENKYSKNRRGSLMQIEDKKMLTKLTKAFYEKTHPPIKEAPSKKMIGCGVAIACVAILAIAICVASSSSKKSDNKNETTTENSSASLTGSTEADSTSTETSASDSSESSSSSTETDYSTDSSLTVKDGDKVNIDYVGYIDGKAFDGGDTQGQGTDLTIGSGSYIDDFEDQLIGAHPGDKVEVKVTFPENYGNDELNGKEATFKVTVNGIYE